MQKFISLKMDDFYVRFGLTNQFMKDSTNQFMKELKRSFKFVKLIKPASSRSDSAEIFIFCSGFMNFGTLI